MINADSNGSVVADMGSFSSLIARRLQKIYKSDFSESVVNRILAITMAKYKPCPALNESDIIMITYGNTLQHPDEKPLQTLHRFMENYLHDTINCIHILPFFPYTSDDGFSVSDFTKVNPELGDWEDIERLRKKYWLMIDLVLNHVSSQHLWFKNYIHNREPGRSYFIEAKKDCDYSMVVRPRSTPLFTVFNVAGEECKIWTTFSDDQVDLDFTNSEVLLEMIRLLIFYIQKGARFIRLDAIAYIWKRVGTPCLHLDETHEIVKLLRDIAVYVCPGVVIITETNVPNTENWSYFGNGDEAHMVYQFSFPPLLLYTFFSGSSVYLNEWALEIPFVNSDQSFLNYTASHDGIGVRPLEGILPDSELASLIEGMVGFGGMISMKANPAGTVSPYEINITYFDAMKGTREGIDALQAERFLCSQTIMMAMKGIPAFYVHSLLASHNDYEGVSNSGRARSINRKQLDYNEIVRDFDNDTERARIFKELIRLINIRRRQKAFHPASRQEILDINNQVFAFIRFSEESRETIYCISNISVHQVRIPVLSKKGYDLISDSEITEGDHILLKPCQSVWLTETPVLTYEP